MSTIFTYARAAKKVILLLEKGCGCGRGQLTCESRLESDLGVSGADAYNLLSRLETELKVDMSEFDGDRHISPEGMNPEELLFLFSLPLGAAVSLKLSQLAVSNLSLLEGILIGLTGAILTGLLATKAIAKMQFRIQPKNELVVRDLVRAVEARKWVPSGLTKANSEA